MAPRTSNRRQKPQRLKIEDNTNASGSGSCPGNILKQAIENATQNLREILSDFDDKSKPKIVWLLVTDALEKDPNLKEYLANKEEFYGNVKRKGEKKFIDTLRAMAAGSKAWEDLFEDDVFFKEMQAADVGVLHKATTSADSY